MYRRSAKYQQPQTVDMLSTQHSRMYTPPFGATLEAPPPKFIVEATTLTMTPPTQPPIPPFLMIGWNTPPVSDWLEQFCVAQSKPLSLFLHLYNQGCVQAPNLFCTYRMDS